MNNKTQNIVIGILLVVIFCLCGYIIYEKIDDKNNIIAKDEQETDLITKFVGTYIYQGEYVDREKNSPGNTELEADVWSSGKMAREKLELSESGHAKATASNVRAGGYAAEGNWYISNNKLIIINEECQPISIDGKVEYPNCQPIWTYTYKLDNENIILTSSNNTMATIELKKEQ